MKYATFTANGKVIGHYDEAIHGPRQKDSADGEIINNPACKIPLTAVPMTEEEWRLSCAGELLRDIEGICWIRKPHPTEDELLVTAKLEQLAQINKDCESAIVSGFESAALGAAYHYQSDRDDQTNLLGLVAADEDLPLKCLAADATDWSYLLHTAAQLKQVLHDGANHKLQLLQRCNDIKIRIKNAQTLEAITAEVWATE